MEAGKKGRAAFVWSVFWPVLLYELLGALVVLFVSARSPFNTLYSLTGQAGLVCALVFGLIYFGDLKRTGKQDRPLKMSDLPALAGAMVLAMLLSVAGNVLAALTSLPELSEGFQSVETAMESENILVLIWVSVLTAPVSEELMVRGVICGRLRERLSFRVSAVVSAILFGLLHGNLVQGIYGFVMGLYFAWCRERFQNIWVPVLAHMAANLIIIVLAF